MAPGQLGVKAGRLARGMSHLPHACFYLLIFSITCSYGAAQTTDVSKHSLTWRTLLPEPGLNIENVATFHNSMPIGNGNVAANVNYEAATDTIAVLLSSWLVALLRI